ncbi:hypothetical protein LCGC14_1190880 [marine sediment metagenome]|uniref:Uncharacterized protein n=1 Tax=marine sediment metagenome TaxID=412755 RepID=A0A0F9PPR3_9ZZZZ
MSLLTTLSHPDALEFNAIACGGILAILNGLDRPQKYEPESKSIKPLGLLNPEVELTVTPGASASPSFEPKRSPAQQLGSPGNLTGDFIYSFVEVDSGANQGQGRWSGPPRDSEGVSVTLNNDFAVLEMPPKENPEADEFWIYRGLDDGVWPILGRIARISAAETLYVDGGETPDFTNFPLDQNVDTPPIKTYGMRMQRRLLLWGNEPFTTVLNFTLGSNEATYVSGDLLDPGIVGMVLYPEGSERGHLITNFLSGSPGTVVFQDDFDGTITSPDSSQQETKIARPSGELAWSEPDDYANFPLANVRFVELGGGDTESGCGVVNGRGLLFTTDKTWGLAFDVTPALGVGQVVELSHSLGCLAHRTIQDCNAILLWLAEGGIAASTGGAPRIISDEVADQFEDIIREPTGRARLAFALNWRAKRRYICFVPVAGDTIGCSRAIVVDYKQVPGEPPFRFAIYNFNLQFVSGSIEKHTVVSGNQVNYVEFPVLGDSNGFLWTLGVGDADGPSTGTVTGTITAVSTSPSLIEDSAAAFDITGIGLRGIPLTIVRASDGAEQTVTISRNTATQMTSTDPWDWLPSVGDTYRIGQIDAYYRTGWINAGMDSALKKLEHITTTFEVEDGGTLGVGVYHDMATVVRPKPVEGRDIDLSTASGRVKKKLSGDVDYQFMAEYRNKNPNEPWTVRQSSIDFDMGEI